MDLTKADLTHFRDPEYLLIPPSARLDARRALKVYTRHLCEAGFAYRPATLVGAKCLTLLA